MLRPGEGEERPPRGCCAGIRRLPADFDVVCGDALYFDAPFSDFCLEHHKHALVVVQGGRRPTVKRPRGSLPGSRAALAGPPRTVRYWDADGSPPVRGRSSRCGAVHTVETAAAATGSRASGRRKKTCPCGTGDDCRSGNCPRGGSGGRPPPLGRGERLLQHLLEAFGAGSLLQDSAGGDRKLVWTLFLAYVLLQCFGQRNLKPPLRAGRDAARAGGGTPAQPGPRDAGAVVQADGAMPL